MSERILNFRGFRITVQNQRFHCELPSGLAYKICLTRWCFKGFPAEIRFYILDLILGVSSGRAPSVICAYASLVSRDIYWWEPHLYCFSRHSIYRTCQDYVPGMEKLFKHLDPDGEHRMMHRAIEGRLHYSDAPTANNIRVLVDNILPALTHPRAIELTQKMINYYSPLVITD